MYMFFDILTENIFNVVLCCRKNPKFYLLWPPYIADADIIFSFRGFFFFSRIISVVAEWICLPYFYTWCGFSTNLECRSENVLHAACWKYRMQNGAKTRHLRTIAQLCPAVSSTIGKKTFKHQYLLNTSSQYGELRLISGCLGHLSKF